MRTSPTYFTDVLHYVCVIHSENIFYLVCYWLMKRCRLLSCFILVNGGEGCQGGMHLFALFKDEGVKIKNKRSLLSPL